MVRAVSAEEEKKCEGLARIVGAVGVETHIHDVVWAAWEMRHGEEERGVNRATNNATEKQATDVWKYPPRTTSDPASDDSTHYGLTLMSQSSFGRFSIALRTFFIPFDLSRRRCIDFLRKTLERRKTTTAPLSAAVYETRKPSQSPNEYPERMMKVL